MGEPRPFRAPNWARGPHAQTLLARVLRPPRGPNMTRERLETPDGDFIDVDWGPDPGPEAPIVLILHGLEGSSKRRYVLNLATQLVARGLRPLAMNFRGCSGESNRALRFYHSGETKDPAWVIQQARDRYPGRRFGAVGFSLGGNVLLKMLGERSDGGERLLDAAGAMSVPYDLAAGADLLEQTFMGRRYSDYFLRSLRGKVESKRKALGGSIDVDAALASRSIREFDDRVTAPLGGFDGADHYYASSSSRKYLAGIGVPTLLLHAVDDPFLPAGSIPRPERLEAPAVRMVLHARGGHVGFLTGTVRRPCFWGEETLADFLAASLSRASRTGSG